MAVQNRMAKKRVERHRDSNIVWLRQYLKENHRRIGPDAFMRLWSILRDLEERQ